MGILLQDTRYGLRNLVQTLGFIVVAMLNVGAWWQSQHYHLQRNVLKCCRSPNLTA